MAVTAGSALAVIIAIGSGKRTAPTATSGGQERIKMRNEFISDEYVATFGTGSISTLDTSVKTRKKKHPIGFAPPKPQRKVKPNAKGRS